MRRWSQWCSQTKPSPCPLPLQTFDCRPPTCGPHLVLEHKLCCRHEAMLSRDTELNLTIY